MQYSCPGRRVCPLRTRVPRSVLPWLQMLGPLSQRGLTVNTLLLSFLYFSASKPNYLSGRQSSASSPNVGRCRFATHRLMPITVPRAKKCPQMLTPSSSITRSSGKQKGGWRRTPSLMQASRYGKSRTSDHAGSGCVEACARSMALSSS